MRRLDVLLLGWGKMGHVEGKALHDLRTALSTKDIDLRLSVVDRIPERLEAARPFADFVFPTVDEALVTLRQENRLPEILAMALNDNEHYPTFKKVLDAVPSLKGVFSEKPLTETQEETDALVPLLKDKFVSLNTVINFSPVFDKFNAWTYGQDLALTKIECFWHKDRTKDTRPTIGISTDIVHPLGVVSEMFNQRAIHLVGGTGTQGLLSEKAPNVLYEINSDWMTQRGVPVSLYSSYAETTQRRCVMAHFVRENNEKVVASFDFDFKPRTDRLVITKFAGRYAVPSTELVYIPVPQDIKTGMPGMTPDRVSAFIGWSMRAYLDPLDLAALEKISNLGSALNLQKMVEEVHRPDTKLGITNAPASSVLARRLTA